MNLGIAGRWALVCAASKGVNVVITARGEQVLNETAGGAESAQTRSDCHRRGRRHFDSGRPVVRPGCS